MISVEVWKDCQLEAPVLTAPGYFAGTLGTRRILKMFDKYKIKATWFIPGHSLEYRAPMTSKLILIVADPVR